MGMAARQLPEDVWLLLSDWSANPALALVDRLRRRLLAGRYIMGRLNQESDLYRLERWVQLGGLAPVGLRLLVAPSLLQRLRLPTGMGMGVRCLRVAITTPTSGPDEELVDELTGHFLAGWLGQGFTLLQSLTIALPGQSLCEEGFGAIWNATAAAMPHLRVLSLDVASNSIGDDFQLNPVRSPQLVHVCVNLANNEITLLGLASLCDLWRNATLSLLRSFHLELSQNALTAACGGTLAAILRCVWNARDVCLGLGGNRITTAGVRSMVQEAMQNVDRPFRWSHLVIDLCRNGIGVDGFDALGQAFASP